MYWMAVGIFFSLWEFGKRGALKPSSINDN